MTKLLPSDSSSNETSAHEESEKRGTLCSSQPFCASNLSVDTLWQGSTRNIKSMDDSIVFAPGALCPSGCVSCRMGGPTCFEGKTVVPCRSIRTVQCLPQNSKHNLEGLVDALCPELSSDWATRVPRVKGLASMRTEWGLKMSRFSRSQHPRLLCCVYFQKSGYQVYKRQIDRYDQTRAPRISSLVIIIPRCQDSSLATPSSETGFPVLVEGTSISSDSTSLDNN